MLPQENTLEPVTCPYPTKVKSAGNPPCQLPCPTPVYSDSEWTTLMLLKLILSSVSFICDLWTFIIMISIKERREGVRKLSQNILDLLSVLTERHITSTNSTLATW